MLHGRRNAAHSKGRRVPFGEAQKKSLCMTQNLRVRFLQKEIQPRRRCVQVSHEGQVRARLHNAARLSEDRFARCDFSTDGSGMQAEYWERIWTVPVSTSRSRTTVYKGYKDIRAKG